MKAPRLNTRTFLYLCFALTLTGSLLWSSFATGSNASAQQKVKTVDALGNEAQAPASGSATVDAPTQDKDASSAEIAAATTSDGEIGVFVELTDAPAATVYADKLESSLQPREAAVTEATSAARTQLAKINRAQETLAATLLGGKYDATEIYRVQRVLNGIAVSVPPGQLAALRQLPGIKAVHLLMLEYPTNSTSVPFVGAPELWNNAAGAPGGPVMGAGIKVGIIDTGIDYQHSNFGGRGLLADYQANNRTQNVDGYFPTQKVAGGFDFAGDNYNGSAATAAPDPDPMDCNGHGTHVAGTAAGLGVNSDGTTFTGPYGTNTPFGSLRIGPGVAPRASLYALRVFGCNGGTNVTVAAIEWAIDPNGDGDFEDRLDVINMSLGSNFGVPAPASSWSPRRATPATPSSSAAPPAFRGGPSASPAPSTRATTPPACG
jgi:subtilisin family serine protease